AQNEVTSNDWKDYYTKPSMKKSCKDCHAIQSDVQRKTDTHVKIDCVGCHMPFTMTCENFQAIQRPDMAGFDAVRRSHVWNIKVDPKAKMMDPAEGQSRASSSKGWHMNRDEKGHGYLDLMWSCARTANAEPEVTDNKGCHSPFMSELEKGLQYSDQQQIYDEVMKWQTPVKDAFKKADGASKRIVKLLEVTKLTPNAKTEVMMLLDKAQEILTQVKKDGSWGVHAPKYLKQRVETANAFLDKAQQIMDAGDFPVATAAKK
ncbi:MAG: cytochrome C, partial [Duodenibacillus sp.]|nr:cytochrome C [Duodenibacillus sp.]